MIRRALFGTLTARIALASLAVTAAALLVIAIGVLAVSQAQFERLMVAHGSTAEAAHAMFDQTVSIVFLVVLVMAAALSLGLAVLLARRLSRPLERMGRAAHRIAQGDYQARVEREGPEEVGSLADSFNQMAESLAEQERLRHEFIINAAHELRTPLTNLQGYLEALRDGVIPTDREIFASLHEEADRLVRLSRSLDALADGDVSKGPQPVSTVDVVGVIQSALDMARPSLQRRRIAVQTCLPDRLVAQANHDHLAQILANLLQNATRYTPEGGEVTVAAQARPADVLVSVTNTGDGIPAADVPHVFERFYRVEKSRDRARGGAGIGLAIVQQLVETGGGRVGVESQDGLTRFFFTVPTVPLTGGSY